MGLADSGGLTGGRASGQTFATGADLNVRWLGRVRYAEAYDLQHALFERRVAGLGADYLLLLEHPNVFTLGRRASSENLLLEKDQFDAIGADVIDVDRGGDVTYHGPGQLIAYPIIRLARLDVVAYVRSIEDAVIATVAQFGVEAERDPDYTGVWVGEEKLCAIGVRVSRMTTMHGLALNVTTDLSYFDAIVPCGIESRGVTSLEKLTGERPKLSDLVPVLADELATSFGGARQNWAKVSWPRDEERTVRPEPPARRAQVTISDGARGDLGQRRPEWMRVKARFETGYHQLKSLMRGLDLHTVCEEAGCPNIYECWGDKTATLMLLGDQCTRACGFCKVGTERPGPVDLDEPRRVAEAIDYMGLEHAVLTSVARDDLPDGGASVFAESIRRVRALRPGCDIEVLVPDFKGDRDSLELVLEAGPRVLNHNLETVARLQRSVRGVAGYARTLTLLARSRAIAPTVITKSGIMLGLGEKEEEVLAALEDLASVGVGIVTIGQYLQPSKDHLPVARWWRPDEFEALRIAGEGLGISHVEAGPLVRSSYHAKASKRSVEFATASTRVMAP